MAAIFGAYVERGSRDQEFLQIAFSPTSIPLQHRWRNNGLSADFLSDYVSTFFPGEDSESADRREEIKSAVAFVANELLENAMKFNYTPLQYPVTIGMHLDQHNARFYVTNSVDPKAIEGFQAVIQRLLSEDTNDLYMEALEKNEGEENAGSGLGYLT
ncbi:MAG: slr1658 superfamily regulator, partial [Gammaproteobacteria bacterium]